MVYALVALALACALVWLSLLPGRLSVRRSIVIRADRQTVFDRIRNLRGWRDWSPWLIHAPDARLAYSESPELEGGSYSWDGTLVGAGTLTNDRFDAPARIEQRIEFLRPFKSSGLVGWELAERDGGTEATWSMDSPMPFFLRPLIGTMARMVGNDYELGLAMLRGVLDPDAGRPHILFLGPGEREPVSALTIPFSGGVEEMSQAMAAGFPRLAEHLGSAGRELAGAPFSAIHKARPKTMQFELDIAVPVDGGCPAGPFAAKRLPGGRYYSVRLEGSYDFLRLAWPAAMAHLRMLKLKHDPSRPFYEVYENDHRTVAHSNEIRTRLDIPVR